MIYLKDLILTDAFLIKGHINTAGQRLSTFLNNFHKRFLEVEEATVRDQVQDTSFTTARMLLRVEEILLAHEREDIGDEVLRHLAEEERDDIPVTIQFNGVVRFQLLGKMKKRAVERDSSGQHDFLVVVEPKLLGLTSKALDYFEDLPYLIVNKSRIAHIVE
jgi:hypothetical protein